MQTKAEQEAAWTQLREEVYASLLRDGRAQVSSDAILHTRQYFLSDGCEFTPKAYALPCESDAVHLVCAAVPESFAAECRQIGEQLAALVPREPATDHARTFINDEETMHVTLFHTSHPDELIPDARTRQPQEIASVRAMASQFVPLPLKPRQLILCSSGAIVLVYDALSDGGADPFTVDRLREAAKDKCRPFPTKIPQGIIHTTIARLLSPDIPADVIRSIHEKCDELTTVLQRKEDPVVIKDLWFLQESHHYWAKGEKTVIPLGGAGK